MRTALLFWLGGLATALAGPLAHAQGDGCASETLGLNPSIWNTSAGTFLGSAIGQSFLAVDTLIARITVWRPPNSVDAVGSHLYVTTVDTTGRPLAQFILQDGPTIYVRNSDPPGQLIRMDFVIEPPLALPRPGLYAFFVRRQYCDIGETLLIANNTNPYPHGLYWVTPRTAGGPCALRNISGGSDLTDLLFEIEYCDTNATPVKQRTWGELKVLYR